MKASYCTFVHEGRQVLKKNKGKKHRTEHRDTVISEREILLREKSIWWGFKLKRGERNVVLINGFHFEHAKNSLDKSRDKILQEKPFDSNCSVGLPIRPTAAHFQALSISTLYVTKLIKFL